MKKSERLTYKVMFPRNWDLNQVNAAIMEAYATRVKVNKNQFLGVTKNGMEINLFLNSKDQIESAYPNIPELQN